MLSELRLAGQRGLPLSLLAFPPRRATIAGMLKWFLVLVLVVGVVAGLVRRFDRAPDPAHRFDLTTEAGFVEAVRTLHSEGDSEGLYRLALLEGVLPIHRQELQGLLAFLVAGELKSVELRPVDEHWLNTYGDGREVQGHWVAPVVPVSHLLTLQFSQPGDTYTQTPQIPVGREDERYWVALMAQAPRPAAPKQRKDPLAVIGDSGTADTRTPSYEDDPTVYTRELTP